jgi:hypothetical protein
MTPAQRIEQAEWEAGLSTGKYTLEDVLMMTLQSGNPASPGLVARIEQAFTDQREGRRELADSFGSGAHGNERQAIQSELIARQVFSLVDELHRRHPKGHPDHLPLSRSGSRTRKTGPTAYSRAAEILAPMAEATVVNRYKQGKSLPDRQKG